MKWSSNATNCSSRSFYFYLFLITKSMKKSYFLVLFVSLLFTQCTDDDKGAVNQLPITFRSCIYNFSSQEIAGVGNLHNVFLDEILSEANCEAVDMVAEYRSIAADILEREELSSAVSEWILDHDSEFDITDYTTEFEEYSEVEGFYNDIIVAIGSAEDYDDLSYALNLIRGDAYFELDCVDETFILSCISVANKSAYYWFPVALGGLGNEGCGTPMGLRWWERVIVGDVAGLATGFMALGIGGMIGMAIPGSNAAILGGLALSAGLDSALALAGG